MAPQFIYAQVGSREHYAPARALWRSGTLKHFCVDLWNPLTPRIRRSPRLTRIFKWSTSFYHPELATAPRSELRAWGIAWRLALRTCRTQQQRYRVHLAFARLYCRLINALRLPEHDYFFGFNGFSLEVQQRTALAGGRSVLCQVDPGDDFELVAEENARWPGWQQPEPQIDESYFERVGAEWQAASHILVNSSWSKASIVRQGADAAKIFIVPLAFEMTARPTARPPDAGPLRRPLRVLYVGGIILRRGVQYLLEAVRRFDSRKLQVTLVGNLFFDSHRMASPPENVRILPWMPPAQLEAVYGEHDVFVFPTLSDGFGLVQLEAMAHGLPVIATTNCGDVVTDSANGFRVPIRDSEAIAQALGRYLDEPELLARHSRAAVCTAERHSIDAYAERLLQSLENPEVRPAGSGVP